jgi:hypothetical protein
MSTPVTQKRPAPNPNVIDGDVLYFQHKDHGALSGRVHAVGKDGVTVAHETGEDGFHRVPWADVLGHKERRARKLTLVERGEDGAIAEDEDGKRVFVEGEIPEEEKPLVKSFSEAPAFTLKDQAAIDAALISAGFVPSIEYIRKSYGEHWNEPQLFTGAVEEQPAIDLEPLIKAIAEVKAHADMAVTNLRSEIALKLAPNAGNDE